MSLEEVYQVVNAENDMVVFQGSMDECLQRIAYLENRYRDNIFEMQETFQPKEPSKMLKA